jgi:hypothetical protein
MRPVVDKILAGDIADSAQSQRLLEGFEDLKRFERVFYSQPGRELESLLMHELGHGVHNGDQFDPETQEDERKQFRRDIRAAARIVMEDDREWLYKLSQYRDGR